MAQPPSTELPGFCPAPADRDRGSPGEQGPLFDAVWRNARLATLAPGAAGLGVVERGAVASRAGRIALAGPERDLPSPGAAEAVDCGGRWITPGLVDCHTHLVYAGNRTAEFEQRLAGASYAGIARAGGGIASSVAATREAGPDRLVAGTLPRLDFLIAEGVTTVEVESGYGLDGPHEAKQLRAARQLAALCPVSITTTFLGAHALPPGSDGDKDAYIAQVCEDIAFSPEQVARVFAAARRHGLPVKLHADQIGSARWRPASGATWRSGPSRP